MPGAFDAIEANFAKLDQMRLDAFDKAVAVQKAAAGPKEVVDCTVTGEDLFAVCQVMEGDGGDREVERAADQLRP